MLNAYKPFVFELSMIPTNVQINMHVDILNHGPFLGLKFKQQLILEPCHEKTGFLHMRKQRRRSASR